MAAVRKQGGKVVVTEPVAVPRAPGPPRAPVPPAGPPPELVAVLEMLEDDRRAHDKLAQTARQKRHDDEEIGAKAVCAYIQTLQKRLGVVEG